MKTNNRNFIILSNHLRLKRLWQFFFTGWGLVMIAALVAGSLFTKQLLWTPISAVNMKEIINNQFKMSNASFSGTDANGEPFTINVKNAFKEYDKPDIIYMEQISGTTVRIVNDKKITDKIHAKTGQYNNKAKTIILYKNVNINSSNGDNMLTDELVIKL
jgi:hypothetical protein